MGTILGDMFKKVGGGLGKGFASWLGQISTWIALLVATVLAVASLVGGIFWIPTKTLGVLIAGIGCLASGILFALCLRKSGVFGSKDAETRAALQKEIEKLRCEKDARIAALEADNERLKHQRIDVNSFAPILKLGLAEADMSVRDVKIEWMDDFKPGNMLTNVIGYPARSKYVGVIQRSFKAVYGVDLMKLKICEDNDCLRIAGIVPENIGIKDDETRWLLRQTQTFRLKGTPLTRGDGIPQQCAIGDGWGDGEKFWQIDKEAPFEGSLDLNKTAEMASAQEHELGERINRSQGAEFRMMNGYIQQMAQGFVRLLLAPAHKPVVFVQTPLAEIADSPAWLSLEDFAAGFNNKLLAENKP